MSGPRRIDVHHHMVPSRYAQWLRERGLAAGGLPIPDWSVDASLELMDARGIFAIPDAQRASIDRDAAETLLPRLRRTA